MKTPSEIEYRTLRFLEGTAAGSAPVDAAGGTSACFASWPGPQLSAARRLAAHANAARGQSLLWLVGVRNGKPVGAAAASGLEAWLAGITRHFDGLAPRIHAFNVPVGRNSRGGNVQVVALSIETERAPFVIRRSGKPSSFEVPWFDAADKGIRSAGRLELVKLLAPLQDLPRFEVLEAELTFYHNPHATGGKTLYRWTLDGSLYVMPSGETRVVVPLHRCHVGVGSPDGQFSSEGTDLSLTADKGSPAVRVTESAALIEGLGRVFVYGCGATGHREIAWKEKMTVRLDLAPAGVDRAAVALAELKPEPVRESNQAGRWKL